MNLRPNLTLVSAALFAAAGLALMTGCSDPQTLVNVKDRPILENDKDYNRELGPGEYALRKITDPKDIPDYTVAFSDLAGLEAQIQRSLSYMGKPSAKQFFPVSGISHEQVKLSLEEMLAIVRRGGSAASLNAEFRRRFDCYTSVGCDNRGTVLFTGYYTPIFEASFKQDGAFKYPLYRLPTNHVKDEITGKTLGLRKPDGTIDPNYPARKELIASGMLKGLEFVYFKDPVEAYVVSVQGSAILNMTDGSRMEIGYAGTNGKDYRSIGSELVKRGKLKKSELSLKSIMAYFHANPGAFDEISMVNERYIFFQQVTGGPFGSLNEQVVGGRSIATDKSIFPRAALCLVTNKALPSEGGGQKPVSRFVLDQDTGGAIRAPGRLDYYWGVGEGAAATAGHTYAEGRLYYPVLNDAEMAIARAKGGKAEVSRVKK
jgi:membrane-bound lytic murein transglycosylase A